MAGGVLTAIGFVVLEGYLQNTDGGILARVGAAACVVAGAVLVIFESSWVSGVKTNTYATVVSYVVLAFLAQAAIGVALLQAGSLPAWAGWFTIIWNVGWLVLLPIVTPRDIYFPVLHLIVPLVVGVLLLWKR